MSGGASVPSGGNPFKNIAVGVITTVLGATAVYFLGFHDTGKEDKHKKKEATLTAWNSLIQYEKLFQQSADKMICLGETEQAAKEVTDEMEQMINDMSNIKKEEGIDNRMETLVDRRIESYKKRKAYIEEYYNELLSLIEQKFPDSIARSKATPIQKNLGDRVAALEDRDKIYINELKATLEKTYAIKLDIPNFNLDIKKENLTGKWEMNRITKLNMDSSGQFAWSNDETIYKGKWTLTGEILSFDFDDGSKLSYTISSIDAMVMRLIRTDDGSFAFGCKQ